MDELKRRSRVAGRALIASALLYPFAVVGEVFDFEDAELGASARWITFATHGDSITRFDAFPVATRSEAE